jgi:hypothetical protein
MKVTFINNFFKSTTDKYYTFKKSEHELILLKQFEDGKIFYNNKLYDKDFFYYHKLDNFVQKIYQLRNEFIKDGFSFYFSSLQKLFRVFRVPFIELWEFDPNDSSDEIHNLTRDQYEILVKAYKYEFDYLPRIDLLNPYKKFKDPVKPIIKDLFCDWFYVVGWHAIKPVYPTFSPSLHAHYDDEIKESLVFRNDYSPLDEGTRMKLEWLEEYDEKKKFDEFDINCKTNSYYTRYISYNEVYNKDYPDEKKFKTDLINDFTEEEIKQNYENMINKEKTAVEKWNYVMLNEKNRTAVLNFFEELESIEVTYEKIFYPNYYYEEQDSDIWLGKRIEVLLHNLLNDPRYILVKPLVDAYFEIFRSKGWYHEDESFLKTEWSPTTKKLLKQLMYFDFSYERQYMFAKKNWLTDDFLEIEFEEADEHLEDEYWAFGLGLILGIWLMLVSLYTIICWFSDLNIPFNSPSFLPKFYHSLKACIYVEDYEEELRQKLCPEIYYGIELRRPRSRLITKRVVLPAKFYEDIHYRFSKKRARGFLPYSILDILSKELDERLYGIDTIYYKLRRYGIRKNIVNWRVPFVEPPAHDGPGLFMRGCQRIAKITIKLLELLVRLFRFLQSIYHSYKNGN